MSYPEKPKRKQPITDDKNVLRQFYWRLFIELMIPACLLAALFYIPSALLSNLPNRLSANCTSIHDDIGIRVVSETQATNSTTYYWSNNGGRRWQQTVVTQNNYASARVDCSNVIVVQETLVFVDNHTNYGLIVQSDGLWNDFELVCTPARLNTVQTIEESVIIDYTCHNNQYQLRVEQR